MPTAPTAIRINVNAAIIRDDQILVIEFNDENGIHYNLPGGGVDTGESLEAALKRECLEEARAQVEVGQVLLVWEYVPSLHGFKYGPTQRVGLVFKCELAVGAQPALPENPDPNQTGVKWIPISHLSAAASSKNPPLFPNIGNELFKALMDPGLPTQHICRLANPTDLPTQPAPRPQQIKTKYRETEPDQPKA